MTITCTARSIGILAACYLLLAMGASAQAQRQITLTFNNRTSSEVKVYWINVERREEAYGTIKPGTTYRQPSFAGHQWVLRGADGALVTSVTARVTEEIRIEEPRTGRTKSRTGGGGAPPVDSRPAAGSRAEVSWSNQRDADVEVFWIEPSGKETSYGLVKPGGSVTQVTSVGHAWVIRDAATKQELQRFTVSQASQAVAISKSGTGTTAKSTDGPMPRDGASPFTPVGPPATTAGSAVTYWLGVPAPSDANSLVFSVRVPDDVARKIILRNDDKAPGAKSFQRTIGGKAYDFYQNELGWDTTTVARGGLSWIARSGSVGETWDFASTGGDWPTFKRALDGLAVPYRDDQPTSGWYKATPIIVAVSSTTAPDLKFSLAGPYDTAGAISEQAGFAAENSQIVAVPFDGGLAVGWREHASGKPLGSKLTLLSRSSGGYSKAWEKQLSLPALGGVTTDGANFYALSAKAEDLGKELTITNYRAGVLQLAKFDRSGNQVWLKDLNSSEYLGDLDSKGAADRGIYSPFTGGTGQLAYGNGRLIVGLATNTLPDLVISSRHQTARFFAVGQDGAGSKSVHDVSGRHSFDQRVIFDGTDFVIMDLGDAGWYMPAAGITVRKAKPSGAGGAEFAPGAAEGVYIYARHGEAGGGNFSFTSLGDIAVGDRGYSVLFSSQKGAGTPPASGWGSPIPEPRNLAMVHVVKSFETVKDAKVFRTDIPAGEAALGNVTMDWRRGYFPGLIDITRNIVDSSGPTSSEMSRPDKPDLKFRQHGVVWLTSHTSAVSVERPKLVKLGSDRYLALWEEWSYAGTGQNLKYQATKAMLIGEYGNVLRPPTTVAARLNRGGADRPFLLDGKAAWLTGSTGAGKLTLYTVDQNLSLSSADLGL